MTDLFDRLLWSYRAVYTQTNAGGGTIQVDIIARERMILLYGSIGPDDYAADRSIEGFIRDEAGPNSVARLIPLSPFDNETLMFPVEASVTPVPPNTSPNYASLVVLGKGERMVLRALTLVQNETMTVALKMLTSSAKPSVVSTGSGGTVTVVVTYDIML